jgi:hypothetical protein
MSKPAALPGRDPDGGPSALPILGFTFGLAKPLSAVIANYIYQNGSKALYDAKLATVGDNGYMFLSVYALSLLWPYLFAHSQGRRSVAGVPRPDQHLYVVVDDYKNPKETKGYAIMEHAGLGGEFNRCVAVSDSVGYWSVGLADDAGFKK